jgi:DNA-binding Lrp family transcriptional regulator
MSVKVSAWVWHDCPSQINGVAIAGRELVVLLALADISDDDGRCTYGKEADRKQAALAAKTRLSESTFRRAIRRLEESTVITIDQVGLMNEYTINMASVQDPETPTGQSDLLVTPDSEAVDEDAIAQSDRYYRSTVTGHKDVNVKETYTQSSDATHVKAREEKSDDDQSHPRPTPAAIRHRKVGIDWPTVLRMVPAFTHFAPDDLHAIGAEILGRAKSAVVDETAYVARALHNDPFEWEQAAFALDAARTSRGGNPF